MTKRKMISSTASKIMCGANEDIISDLPKNIMDMILEALPIRDAVRTCLLSRKWQYRWVTVSKLVFDDEFFKSTGIRFSTDLKVKDIINRILLLHIGPITKFTLHNDSGLLSMKDNASPWLHFLLRNGIKELTLRSLFKLGSHLFSCLELTHLNIVECDLYPLAAFEGFPNLTTLELDRVFTNGRFGDIISACHLLERVSIEECYGIRNLVVSSPNLKYLHVKQVHELVLRTICLKSSKNVATLSISLCDHVPGQKMEKLVLGDNILEFSAASVLKRLPTSLENLKKLVLSYVDFNDVAHIVCTHCMIQNSPKLSELEIWGQCSKDSSGQDLKCVDDFGDHDRVFGQLQTVKLMCLRDLKAEIALIKLLLANSPLLDRMSIQAASGISTDKAFSMCKKLMQFGRASTKAALIYL